MNNREKKNKSIISSKKVSVGNPDTDGLLYEIKKKDRLIARLKTSLTEKEYQIKEAEDKFGDFYDLAPICYVTLNEDGHIEEINLTASELMGAFKKTALKKPFIHFLLTKDIKRFNELLRECKHTYEQLSGDFIIKTRGKENLIINLTVLPFLDYKKNKILFRVFFYDITEKKKFEKLLYESEKRFRLIAEATPVMIWMTDINGQLEYINRTEHMFLGLKLTNVSTEFWLETRHPDDRKKFMAELMGATRDQRSFSVEIRARNHKGEYRWIISTAVPRFLEKGIFAGLIGSGIDITEEKNIRTSLLKSLDEKEMLMKEVHHRVKNNLQMILSLVNIQSSLLEDVKMIDLLKTFSARVRAMAVLHEKMYQTNNEKWINAKEYLGDLISSVFTSFNQSKGVQLKLNIWEGELDVSLSISIGLIINELLTNSIKYAFPNNRKGEINIAVRRSNDHQLYILVEDNGVGMPEGFDLGNSKSFGLVLVNSLVEQYGGVMEIIQNGNTEFHITLQLNE
jgi:PAS domain S-box-containing protein